MEFQVTYSMRHRSTSARVKSGVGRMGYRMRTKETDSGPSIKTGGDKQIGNH